MNKVFQQGHADGMCGLYCVLNFLMLQNDWKNEKPAKVLEYVLEAAEAEGVFSPKWLTNGFRSAELKGVLNRVFDRWWMPFQAYFLCEIERPKGETTLAAHQRVVKAGGALISGSDGQTHWLLFVSVDDSEVIIDSANIAKPLRKFDGRSHSLCSEDSLVILPSPRATVNIGF